MIRNRAPIIVVVTLLALSNGCAREDSAKSVTQPVKPVKMTPVLQELLDDGDGCYDAREQMLVTEFRSPGYHTRIKSWASVHATRESLIYALALLQRNAAGNSDRAADVIRRVVALQDTNPASKTFGVWPWLLEEPRRLAPFTRSSTGRSFSGHRFPCSVRVTWSRRQCQVAQ